MNDQRFPGPFSKETRRADLNSIWNTVTNGSMYSHRPVQQSFSSMPAGVQTAVHNAASVATEAARDAACKSGISSTRRTYSSRNGDNFLVESEVACGKGERQNYVVGVSFKSHLLRKSEKDLRRARPDRPCTVSYSRTNMGDRLVVVISYHSGPEARLRNFLLRFAATLRRPGHERMLLLVGAPGNESRVVSSIISELDIGPATRTVQTGANSVGASLGPCICFAQSPHSHTATWSLW